MIEQVKRTSKKEVSLQTVAPAYKQSYWCCKLRNPASRLIAEKPSRKFANDRGNRRGAC